MNIAEIKPEAWRLCCDDCGKPLVDLEFSEHTSPDNMTVEGKCKNCNKRETAFISRKLYWKLVESDD